MRRRHGDTEYLLVGDQVLGLDPNLEEPISLPIPADPPDMLPTEGRTISNVPVDKEKLFRFDHMFRNEDLPKFRPHTKDLIELGVAMTETAGDETTSRIPAGYTFLGQFIDHDLTFNANQELTVGDEPVPLKSKRSPSLDLDSLYGYEPDKVKASDLGKAIYDGDKLRVGWTVQDPFVNLASAQRRHLHDLFRLDNENNRAAVVDSRNDENLAVAQTHLAFIKFHNAVINQLSANGSPGQLFWDAREQVTRHYQRVILDDFLPRILDEEVVGQIQEEGCKYFVLSPNEETFMPVEFAVAAFRMGHSMLTSKYQWNRIFQSAGQRPQPATLKDLFVFTERGGLSSQNNVLSSWIIDWTRFFDFSKVGINGNEPSTNAGTIDASITSALADLEPIPKQDKRTRSLAVRNLWRGRMVKLPAGQHVAELFGYARLQPKDFSNLPYYETLRKLNFDELTPLWLYVLHEAKVQHDGQRLGKVGSRIVAETFVTLIQRSRISILGPNGKWKPSPDKYTMAHLLASVNDVSPDKDFLNPLG